MDLKVGCNTRENAALGGIPSTVIGSTQAEFIESLAKMMQTNQRELFATESKITG
jgi:hypothetical protein